MNSITRQHPAYPVVLFVAVVWGLVEWLVARCAKRLEESPPQPQPTPVPATRRELLVSAKRFAIPNYSRLKTDELRSLVEMALVSAPGPEAHTNIGQTQTKQRKDKNRGKRHSTHSRTGDQSPPLSTEGGARHPGHYIPDLVLA